MLVAMRAVACILLRCILVCWCWECGCKKKAGSRIDSAEFVGAQTGVWPSAWGNKSASIESSLSSSRMNRISPLC